MKSSDKKRHEYIMLSIVHDLIFCVGRKSLVS